MFPFFCASGKRILLKNGKISDVKKLNLLGAGIFGTAAAAEGSGAEFPQQGRKRCSSAAMEKLGQTPEDTK